MKVIKIGKASDNNCVFPNPTVSKFHAELTIDESNPQSGVIVDINSKNGTFVNGQRITGPTQVSIRDKINVGSQETNIADILSRCERTRVVKKNNKGKSIGRAATCDIVINAPDVSSNHASIWKDNSGNVVIEDNGSTNGTFVNGMRISSHILKKGDRVVLGRNNYFNWEPIFPLGKKLKKTTVWNIAAAVLAILLLAGGGYWYFLNSTWSKEKIYDTYSDTVCLVLAQYGYKIKVGDEDLTEKLFGAPLISINKDGSISKDMTPYTATAFFISKDGKLATNLHVVEPWVDDPNMKELTTAVRKFFAHLGTIDPSYNAQIPDVKVEGRLGGLYIVPNGLPLTDGNLTSCTILKSSDNIERDVAIIQTANRKLPDEKINVLSLENADLSEEAIKQGKTIFTIGYPLGLGLGMVNGMEVQNQVHEGTITQSRGEYEFGHDAVSAGGASGSPIINEKGRLVGVLNAGVPTSQGFNTAIKVKYLKSLMEK